MWFNFCLVVFLSIEKFFGLKVNGYHRLLKVDIISYHFGWCHAYNLQVQNLSLLWSGVFKTVWADSWIFFLIWHSSQCATQDHLEGLSIFFLVHPKRGSVRQLSLCCSRVRKLRELTLASKSAAAASFPLHSPTSTTCSATGTFASGCQKRAKNKEGNLKMRKKKKHYPQPQYAEDEKGQIRTI